MYLHKSELCLDIERLMKTAEDDEEIVGRCNEALSVLGRFKDENIKEYIKDKHCVVETFVLGLKMKKQVPSFVVDYIYTFLVNELLIPDDIKDIVDVVSRNKSWCDTSKMKILQMSYYFTRYEYFGGSVALSLFKAVLRLVEDGNRQIQTTARPIAMHLVDFIFNKACTSHKDRLCFSSEGEELDVKEVREASSEKLPQRTGFDTGSIDDGILFLKYLLSKARESKDFASFTAEIVALITQKEDLFAYREFREIYCTDVMNVLVEQVKEGGSARSIYKILPEISKKHSDLLEGQIQRIFCEMEKSYKLLGGSEAQGFLEFFGGLDLTLFNSHAAVIRRIFFRILDECCFENEASNEKVIACIVKSIDNQMKEREDASGEVHPSTKVLFDRISGILYVKLSGTKEIHPSVEDLLKRTLDFYAAVGDKESLDKFLSITFRLGFSEAACRSVIGNRKYIQDSWDVILKDGKEHLKLVIDSISSFNSEELFFFTKGVGTLETEDKKDGSDSWTPKDKIDLCQCVFSIVKPVVVEPLNVKILEILLMGILEESEKDCAYATKVFCSIVVDYFGQVEVLSSHVENVVFSIIQKMLRKNLNDGGAEILDAILEILRLITPDSGWNIIMQCIETACIPSLYSSLFPIIRWIVEEFGSQIAEMHFKVIISCLHTMCLSESDEVSLKSIFIFQDIGECLVSRKIINHIPKKESKVGVEDINGDTWNMYLHALGEMVDDRRTAVGETAMEYLFAFVNAELNVMNRDEWDFVSRNSLIPLFDKGKRLFVSSEARDLKVSVLLLGKSNDVMRRAFYHKDLFGKFLELVEYGIHNGNPFEIQSLCLEGLRIVTKRVSEAVSDLDSGRRKSDDEDPNRGGESEEDKLKGNGHESHGDFSVGEEKSSKTSTELRNQVLDTYKSILCNISLDKRHPISMYFDLIELFKGFPFISAEVSSFIPFFHRLVCVDDRDLQGKVLELVESLSSLDSIDEVKLQVYINWMNPSDLCLTHLLMSKMGKILSKGTSGRYSEAMLKLVEYSRLPNFWESSVETLVKSSENIKSRSSFIAFIDASKTILEESCMTSELVEEMKGEEACEDAVDDTKISTEGEASTRSLAGLLRRKERMILEFLSFYHGVILRFRDMHSRPRDMQPFDQVMELDIKKAYKIIIKLSELDPGLRKENICFKCYVILFHDLDVVYDDLVPRIRSILLNYNEIEAIYNGLCSRSKQRETYAILDGICKSGSKRLVNDVKDLLVEALKSKDYRIIDYVRRCLEIILIA